MIRFLRAWLLALAALPAWGSPPQGVEFRLQYLAVHGRRQDTLTYDFDGDGKGDVLNTSIDFDADPPARWLALHLQKDGGYPEIPDRVGAVSPRAAALVFGDFLPGGGVEAGFLAEDGVWIQPWDGAPPVKIIHAATFFRSPSPRFMPVWQWAIDYDGDGRHDLVVPLADGYRVYFQTAPGVFGRVATLEADLPEGAARVLAPSAYADNPEAVAAHFMASVDLPKLDSADINGDGLRDLVLIRKDTVTYFLQQEKGTFPSRRPFRVSYRVPTLAAEAKKDTVNFATIRFTDLNQDGLADLVVSKVEGQLGLWDSIKTSVYLHLGTGRGNFVADKRIVIDGVSIEPEFIDMNQDGKLDVFTSRLRTDLIRQAVSALVLGDIAISYEVFQFDPKEGGLLADPVFEKVIFVARKDLEKTGAGAVPLVFIRGDLSSDGRPDLMVLDPKAKELQIHPGRLQETGSGPRIGFDGTAHWRVPVERHPDGVHVLDVNSDGLNDIVLNHKGALGLALARRR
jgi:hypothetical protein